jgi:O-antigen/teichoic acid export membrane protein
MVHRLLKKAKALSTLPFVRGVATFQIGGITMTLVNFISSILYARLLGVSQFGLFAVISAFVGLLSIITAYGQETATATFLAEAIGRKDKKTTRRVLRYYAQASCLAILCFIGLFLLAPAIATATQGSATIGLYAQILIINSILQIPNVLSFIALQIERKIVLITVIENTIDILQIILSTVLILAGFGIWGVLIGTTAISALAMPILFALYDRSAKTQDLPLLRDILRTLFQKDTGLYFRQGFWIALDQTIGKNLYPNVFYMVLNATTSLQTVGVFRIAFRLATLPISIIMPSITRMTTYSIPRIATLDKKNLIKSCKKVLIGTLGISGLATVGAAIVIPPFIPLVYGPAFVNTIPAFLAMLPINMIASMHVISVPLLRVYKRVWVISITNTIGIGIGIGAYFLLHLFLPTLAAISFAVVMFHLNSLALFPYLYRLLSRKKMA